MGVETTLWPDILKAANGNLTSVRWAPVKSTCALYPTGSINSSGSMNHSVLAFLLALWAADGPTNVIKQRAGLTKEEIVSWWTMELGDRLESGLQLKEERSRIYCVWGAVLICWHYRLFEKFPELRDLHRRFRESVVARSSLVTVPWPGKRLRGPDLTQDLVSGVNLYDPLAGARSYSGIELGDGDLEIDLAHHVGVTAWEVMMAELFGVPWSAPQDLKPYLAALKPGKMGLSSELLSKCQATWKGGNPAALEELVSKLTPAYWPCYLLRFENGAACVGFGRSVSVSTDPIYTMAAHRDGFVDILEAGSGRREDTNVEPCGLLGLETVDNGGLTYRLTAWAGGEDRDKETLEFDQHRWSRLLWCVKNDKAGASILWPPADATHPVEPPVVEPPPVVVPPRPDKDDDKKWWMALPLLGGLIYWLIRRARPPE